MGMLEALAIWAAVLVLFSAVLGKVLTAVDSWTTAREEMKRVERRGTMTRSAA